MVWNYFQKIRPSGKKCKDLQDQILVKCVFCGTEMSYCARDGPGNLKSHLKTKACQARQMGVPAPVMATAAPVMAMAAPRAASRPKAPRKTRNPSECNVIKVQTDCKSPCIWRKGKGNSQFCSLKPIAGRRRATAADALLMLAP
jgi:hypothetical protein